MQTHTLLKTLGRLLMVTVALAAVVSADGVSSPTWERDSQTYIRDNASQCPIWGCGMNGPAQSGTRMELKAWADDPFEDGIVLNGPALSGTRMVFKCEDDHPFDDGLSCNGPSLDGVRLRVKPDDDGEHQVTSNTTLSFLSARGQGLRVHGIRMNGPALSGTRRGVKAMETVHCPFWVCRLPESLVGQVIGMSRTSIFSNDECTNISNCGVNGPALDGSRIKAEANGKNEAQVPPYVFERLELHNTSRTSVFGGDECTNIANCGMNGPTLSGSRIKADRGGSECPPWTCGANGPAPSGMRIEIYVSPRDQYDAR